MIILIILIIIETKKGEEKERKSKKLKEHEKLASLNRMVVQWLFQLRVSEAWHFGNRLMRKSSFSHADMPRKRYFQLVFSAWAKENQSRTQPQRLVPLMPTDGSIPFL